MVNSLLSVGRGGRVPLTKLRQEALPPRHTQPGCSVPAPTRAKSLPETTPSAKGKGTPQLSQLDTLPQLPPGPHGARSTAERTLKSTCAHPRAQGHKQACQSGS